MIDRARGLASVFDGVGGVNAGEIASQLGTRVIRQAWKRIIQQQQPDNNSDLLILNDDLDIQVLLHQIVEEAQSAISDEGDRRASETTTQGQIKYPETTAVLVALCRHTDKKSYVMGYTHVGDSRSYLVRLGEPLQRLTRDDNYLTLKIQGHTLNEEEALRIDQATQVDQLSETESEIFDKRNGITQRLGHFTPKASSLMIHTSQIVIFPGDRVLLCSDGIHDNLTDAEIEVIVRHGARTTVARHLVQHALDRSREECLRAKKDDISAIVITYNI